MAGIYRKYLRISRERFERGDYTKEELIKSYIPLVVSIAKGVPCQYIDPDEAIEIALLELTRVINNCTIGSQKALTKLIKGNVNNRIKDQCLHYYRQSVIRSKNRKDPITTVNFSDFDNISDRCDCFFDIELEDTISSIVANPIEETIIRRVLEGGYTNKEIGKEVGVTGTWVGILKEKLLVLLGEKLDV